MPGNAKSADRCEAQVADGQRCLKPGYYIIIVPGREAELCEQCGNRLLGGEPVMLIPQHDVVPLCEPVSLN